jgi:D-xylonolactonase
MEEVASGYGLIEAPVWIAGEGLYFSDVRAGGIHRLSLEGEVATVLPKRRGVGGMAPHAAGGMVFGGRDVAWSDFAGRGATLLGTGDIDGAVGFNDLTADAAGRIWVGSLAFVVFGGGEPKPGRLHVIDLDGTMRSVSDGVMLTNGLGFSPDGTRLYHSDSRSNLVRVYDVGPDGTVGPWRRFADMSGVPDGLKVAADGSVWVADARGARVAVFEPDGRPRADIAVPLPMVTSLCFGGDDLRDLYIVTGSDGAPTETSGTIFRTRTEVAGLPAHVARVKL